MNKIKIITVALIASMMVGCANITIRPRTDYNEGPYFCTDTINHLITRGFNGKPLEQMLIPVFILDWPLDAVTDTILLPYDYIAYSIRKSKWENK